jgi:hypothetical protein
MGIGTSLGSFYDDEFHYQARKFLNRERPHNDDIIANPDKPDKGMFSDNTERLTRDDNIRTPNQVYQNQQLDKVENNELGGIQISDHTGFRPSDNLDDNRGPGNGPRAYNTLLKQKEEDEDTWIQGEFKKLSRFPEGNDNSTKAPSDEDRNRMHDMMDATPEAPEKPFDYPDTPIGRDLGTMKLDEDVNINAPTS